METKTKPGVWLSWAITEPSMSGLSPSTASAFAFGGEGFSIKTWLKGAITAGTYTRSVNTDALVDAACWAKKRDRV